jgi:hypothetical protein
MSPDDRADMENDAAKVDGPQRLLGEHLDDRNRVWVRDTGYGSIMVGGPSGQQVALDQFQVAKLVGYLNRMDKEAL